MEESGFIHPHVGSECASSRTSCAGRMWTRPWRCCALRTRRRRPISKAIARAANAEENLGLSRDDLRGRYSMIDERPHAPARAGRRPGRQAPPEAQFTLPLFWPSALRLARGRWHLARRGHLGAKDQSHRL